MEQYIFDITVKNSEPLIHRLLTVPTIYCFEHLHYLIQVSFDLANLYDFLFFNGNTKDNFESFPFFDDDDTDEMEADGCYDARDTPISQYFATKKNLRYRYGEWMFEIKLKGIDSSPVTFATLKSGEGRIVYEQCGGIYAQMLAQEALTKYAGEPIAKLASKMMHKKNADFSLSRSEFNSCQRLFDKLEIALMRLSNAIDNGFGDTSILDDILPSYKKSDTKDSKLLN